MDTLTSFEQKVDFPEAGGSGGSIDGRQLLLGGHVLFANLVQGYFVPNFLSVWSVTQRHRHRSSSDTACPACGVVVTSPLSRTIGGTKQTELPARLGSFS